MTWFLILNIFFLTVLFQLYRRDKKNINPSKLNFFKDKRTIDSDSFGEIFKQKQENNEHFERVLNILFQYNGETWDAYEVLGLPAGSNTEQAKIAFEIAVKEERSKEPFLRAALEAIIEVKKT